MAGLHGHSAPLVFVAAVAWAMLGEVSAAPAPKVYVSVLDALKGTPELSKLYTALQVTPLFKDATFTGKTWDGTWFAPTNAAFDKMAKATGVTFAKWLAKPATVLATLQHEIVPGYQIQQPYDWLYDRQRLPTLLTLLNGRSKLRVLKNTTGGPGNTTTLQIGGDMGRSKLNAHKPINAGKITLILMDSVLQPNLEKLASPLPAPAFSSLARAVSKLPGLELLWKVLKRDQSFIDYLSDPALNLTLLAPNNQALHSLLTKLELKAEQFFNDTNMVNTILLQHFIPGRYNASQLVAGRNFTTLLIDQPLMVVRQGGSIIVGSERSNATLVPSLPAGLPSMKTIKTGSLDVPAGLGVLHIINDWLLPLGTMEQT